MILLLLLLLLLFVIIVVFIIVTGAPGSLPEALCPQAARPKNASGFRSNTHALFGEKPLNFRMFKGLFAKKAPLACPLAPAFRRPAGSPARRPASLLAQPAMRPAGQPAKSKPRPRYPRLLALAPTPGQRESRAYAAAPSCHLRSFCWR